MYYSTRVRYPDTGTSNALREEAMFVCVFPCLRLSDLSWLGNAKADVNMPSTCNQSWAPHVVNRYLRHCPCRLHAHGESIVLNFCAFQIITKHMHDSGRSSNHSLAEWWTCDSVNKSYFRKSTMTPIVYCHQLSQIRTPWYSASSRSSGPNAGSAIVRFSDLYSL